MKLRIRRTLALALILFGVAGLIWCFTRPSDEPAYQELTAEERASLSDIQAWKIDLARCFKERGVTEWALFIRHNDGTEERIGMFRIEYNPNYPKKPNNTLIVAVIPLPYGSCVFEAHQLQIKTILGGWMVERNTYSNPFRGKGSNFQPLFLLSGELLLACAGRDLQNSLKPEDYAAAIFLRPE